MKIISSRVKRSDGRFSLVKLLTLEWLPQINMEKEATHMNTLHSPKHRNLCCIIPASPQGSIVYGKTAALFPEESYKAD